MNKSGYGFSGIYRVFLQISQLFDLLFVLQGLTEIGEPLL